MQVIQVFGKTGIELKKNCYLGRLSQTSDLFISCVWGIDYTMGPALQGHYLCVTWNSWTNTLCSGLVPWSEA